MSMAPRAVIKQALAHRREYLARRAKENEKEEE